MRFLLVNPSYKETYSNPMARYGVPFYPVLSLATLIRPLTDAGHEVQVIDRCYEDLALDGILERVRAWKPDFVGVTGTTPLFPQMSRVARAVKSIDPGIRTIGGGAHCSALPEQSLEEAGFDYVVYGEGDTTLVDLAEGKPAREIRGLVWRDAGTAVKNPPRPWLEDLDLLPFPEWEAFDIPRYRRYFSRLINQRGPCAFFESSRGCVFSCNYCGSKNTVGRTFRTKSVERVLAEIEYMMRCGFREFYVVDDIFTTDVARVKRICEGILRKGWKIPWQCSNGIRVDMGDQEMFDLMRRAGCYKVAFGFESGDDRVLKQAGKGGRATVEAASRVVGMCKKAGIQVFGFFMVGLLHDTEETMERTIRLGRRLETDLLKVSICIPFPGTAMYHRLAADGLLNAVPWDAYNVYNPRQMYRHPHLSWDTIEKYFRKAYHSMVLYNPSFYWRRLRKGLKSGEFFWDAYYWARFLLNGGTV